MYFEKGFPDMDSQAFLQYSLVVMLFSEKYTWKPNKMYTKHTVKNTTITIL